MQINGDNHSFPKMGENVRYHLVMPTVPRETLPMQYLACCDYFHTSVIFQGSDIYRLVGVIAGLWNDEFKNILSCFTSENRGKMTPYPVLGFICNDGCLGHAPDTLYILKDIVPSDMYRNIADIFTFELSDFAIAKSTAMIIYVSLICNTLPTIF